MGHDFDDKAGDFAPHLGGSIAIGSVVTSATEGSVLFAGAAGVLAQDNAGLFWDDANNRLGIGTATPAVDLSVKPDTDAAVILGRARFDSRTTDQLHVSHVDMTGTNDFAVRQLATGGTLVSCASGLSLALQYNGTTRISIGATGIGFYGTANAAKQAPTGSRGGNAALASLLTALATIGLITDSTSA
jgi:hypothetical protein